MENHILLEFRTKEVDGESVAGQGRGIYLMKGLNATNTIRRKA